MQKFQIVWMDPDNTVLGKSKCDANSFGDVVEALPEIYKKLKPTDRAKITGLHFFKELN